MIAIAGHASLPVGAVSPLPLLVGAVDTLPLPVGAVGSPSVTAFEAAILLLGYATLLATSGRVVTATLSWADDGYAETVTETDRDIGTIVGKTENVLILTLVFVGAYTALAVIFAAKSIVRSDDMKNNSLFYLAGTFVNFTYSVTVGVVVRIALGAGGTTPLF